VEKEAWFENYEYILQNFLLASLATACAINT